MRIAENQIVLLGPPGTGKTTTLIARVEEALNSGIKPEEIAFVSFTKKAVAEAMARACEKFNLNAKRFPLFQTVHALCFRQLGCTKNNMLQKQNYIEFGEWLGYDMSGQYDMGDGVLPTGAAPGDKFLFLDNIARVKCQTIREAWEEEGFDMQWAEVKRFSEGYAQYKQRTGLLDFTDLLHHYIAEGRELNAKIVFVDEAQDLSLVQWRVLQKCYANANQVIIAGDDDQSIFKWSGASLDSFLALEGERQVLSQSYRLPKRIYVKANDIIHQVRHRFTKDFAPTEKNGRVDYVTALEQLNIVPGEETLVLVRNVFLLNQVYDHIKRLGLTYTGRSGYSSVKAGHVQAIRAWERMRRGHQLALHDVKEIYENLRIGHVLARGGKSKLDQLDDVGDGFTWETLRDHYGLLAKPIWHEALEGIPLETREYYITVLRSGNKISEIPAIHVNTIHGVKGGEAKHVVIISDMSKRTFTEFQKDPCSEHRVAFVAITRAKERVSIVMPRSQFSYPY